MDIIELQLDGAADSFTPVARHRKQELLECELDSTTPDRLNPEALEQASQTLQRLLRACIPMDQSAKRYKPSVLLKTMYKEVTDKERFLRYFFLFLENETWKVDNDALNISIALARYQTLNLESQGSLAKLHQGVGAFADHLLDSFFVPLRANGLTRQPSLSTPISELPREVLTSSDRLKNLRNECLERDGHRCVVSGKFDQIEATKRFRETDGHAFDDDGYSLENELLEDLHVCHIIPRSLAEMDQGLNQSTGDTKSAVVWHILRMFDHNISTFIGGPKIDEPFNALCLSAAVHYALGSFHIYFASIDNSHDTFEIKTWLPFLSTGYGLPVIRTFRSDPKGMIRGPSPRLLDIHRAIGNILYLSGAADPIDEFLRDVEDISVVAGDGSTPLSAILKSRFGGGMSEINAH